MFQKWRLSGAVGFISETTSKKDSTLSHYTCITLFVCILCSPILFITHSGKKITRKHTQNLTPRFFCLKWLSWSYLTFFILFACPSDRSFTSKRPLKWVSIFLFMNIQASLVKQIWKNDSTWFAKERTDTHSFRLSKGRFCDENNIVAACPLSLPRLLL